jgi:hypothetical protein
VRLSQHISQNLSIIFKIYASKISKTHRTMSRPRIEEMVSAPTESEQNSSDMCAICFESYRSKATMTNCSHSFCFLCIYDWIRASSNQQASCPYCRRLIIFIRLSYPGVDEGLVVPVQAMASTTQRVAAARIFQQRLNQLFMRTSALSRHVEASGLLRVGTTVNEPEEQRNTQTYQEGLRR